MTLPPLDSEALHEAEVQAFRALTFTVAPDAVRTPLEMHGVLLNVVDAAIRAYLGALPRSPLPLEPSAELHALRAFFWLCWDGARGVDLPSVDDLDGGDIQEWGVKCGLLQKVVATAPCGDGCVCAQYVGDDFPTDCYRPTVARPALHNKEQK